MDESLEWLSHYLVHGMPQQGGPSGRDEVKSPLCTERIQDIVAVLDQGTELFLTLLQFSSQLLEFLGTSINLRFQIPVRFKNLGITMIELLIEKERSF